jgi:hypothetical protein
MSTKEMSRDDEIKAIWKQYKLFYQIASSLLLVGIGIFIGMVAFSSPTDRANYLINLYISIPSVFVTVFVIDFLNRRRTLRQLQEQLVRDAGSPPTRLLKMLFTSYGNAVG